MSWEKTYKEIVKDVSKEQIWQTWQDVNQWHLWDTDIDSAHLVGNFEVGNTFLLKPKSGPKVKIKLIRVLPHVAFTDVTTFPLAKMYGIHEMSETASGLEIIHTVKIEGPLSFLWKKIVAEKIAAGLEEQAEKMLKRARGLVQDEGSKSP